MKGPGSPGAPENGVTLLGARGGNDAETRGGKKVP